MRRLRDRLQNRESGVFQAEMERCAAGKDVVVLHGIDRSTVCTNPSPFVMKAETYLRMAGIKYEYDCAVPFGPKGKFPWITLNGEDTGDSELIIQMLGKKFNKNFSSNLTPEQKGVAKAMQVMCDEHLLWGIVWWRFYKDSPRVFFETMHSFPCTVRLLFLLGVMKRGIKNKLHAQGLGRHTDYEIMSLLRQDLEAISNYLGAKQYLMGSEPCEADCAVFGCMAQYVWGLPGSPLERIIHDEFKNLVAYSDRMRSKFYPDWNQLCKC